MTNRKSKIKVVLIGAGRVGFHMGKRLNDVEIDVIQVFSRQISKAEKLANIIDSDPINSLSQISKKADLYILAVSDNAISEVISELKNQLPKNALVVHTSGATPITVFQNHFKRFGIFYPLQTFSLNKEPDFTQIPICLDSKSDEDLDFLSKIAHKVSPRVYFLTDEHRAVLHVAAVFVNNFVNHLYLIGEKILEEENISLDLLKPLISETAKKIEENSPKKMQTGPAVRGDSKTIEKHLNLLDEHPQFKEIYQILTQNIQKHHS